MNIEKLMDDMRNEYLYGKIDIAKIVEELGSQGFIKLLLENTGSPHSLLRENILGLVEIDYLSHEDCIELLHAYLSEGHLFNGLGNKDGDTVFWRSFSSLCVGYFVSMGGERNFLSQDQYMAALDKGLEYMSKEVDKRGFVMGKGWAHAVGHGADMLLALVKHAKFPMEYADKVLGCIKFHVVSNDRFLDGEEKRLAKVVSALIDKELGEEAITKWIDDLVPRARAKMYTDESYEDVKMIFNVDYFLMSLHFALEEGVVSDNIRKYIKEFVATLWRRAYSDEVV
ncbi:MAG: DUF2785 domain-containing protein [Defluviitaleaceae bacterium]|nr:DUF2785 domain-containing protein [Defluviitaleaceae bacterium]